MRRVVRLRKARSGPVRLERQRDQVATHLTSKSYRGRARTTMAPLTSTQCSATVGANPMMMCHTQCTILGFSAPGQGPPTTRYEIRIRCTSPGEYIHWSMCSQPRAGCTRSVDIQVPGRSVTVQVSRAVTNAFENPTGKSGLTAKQIETSLLCTLQSPESINMQRFGIDWSAICSIVRQPQGPATANASHAWVQSNMRLVHSMNSLGPMGLRR
jgi:hypothetical protein